VLFRSVTTSFQKYSNNGVGLYNSYTTTPNLCIQDFSSKSNIESQQTLEYMKKSTTNMWGEEWDSYK
jgi:hypothetical protein